jgi:hypothetical protein
MAGFQTMEMPRPRFSTGVPQAPRVDIRLVGRKELPIQINPRSGLALVTPALIAKIRKLRSAGVAHSAIVTACNTSRRVVARHTKDIAAPEGGFPSGYLRLPFNVAKAQRMKRAGFSYREIAEDQGVHRNTAVKYLRRASGLPDWKEKHVKSAATRAMPDVYILTGLSRKDIFRDPSAGRTTNRPDIVKARHLVFWLLHRRLDMTCTEVAAFLGGFDHSTVLHGVQRVEAAAVALKIKLDGSRMGAFRRLWVGSWPARNAA